MFDRAAQSRRAIACDRPGCGYSQRPPRDGGSPLVQARVLHAGLGKLGARRPVLVGHSLGAAVAMAYAVEFPDEVGAVVTLAGYVLPVETFHSPLARLLGVPLLGRCCRVRPCRRSARRWRRPPCAVPSTPTPCHPATSRSRQPWLCVRSVSSTTPRTCAASTRRSRRSPRSTPGCSAPLVAVVGMQDHILSPDQGRRLSRMVPGAELVELPRTGHMPQFTQPDAVIAAIARACRAERAKQHRRPATLSAARLGSGRAGGRPLPGSAGGAYHVGLLHIGGVADAAEQHARRPRRDGQLRGVRAGRRSSRSPEPELGTGTAREREDDTLRRQVVVLHHPARRRVAEHVGVRTRYRQPVDRRREIADRRLHQDGDAPAPRAATSPAG